MNTEALAGYLKGAAARPAEFGKFDCVSFVFVGLQIGWGRDYLQFLGYSDRRSAVERLRSSDGLYDAMCEGLGQDLPICELGPGDIAWFPDSTIGLMLPDYIAVKAYRTIYRVPFEMSRSGWKT